MKILQIFGAVVAVHLLAFIFIFASPGCQSGPRTQPTPDATLPSSVPSAPPSSSYYNGPSANPSPVDLGPASSGYVPPAGHATPTRPGSANAVALTPAAPPPPVAPVSTYTVERGDSLWSIAKKHGLTVAEIAKANNVASSVALKPGRKLIIPVKPGAPADAVPATLVPDRPATSGEVVKHSVQVGESLGVIARRYGLSVGELAAANSITDPSRVRAGQQLVIPGSKSSGGRPPASTAATRPAAPRPAATRPVGSSPTAMPAAAVNPPPAEATPASETTSAPPQFDLTPPPPGQDLDAGLKPSDTEVPTIKVEEIPATPTN